MKHARVVMAALLALTAQRGAMAAEAPDLGWMAGHWCSEEGGRRVDELWLPPVGGALHGLSRTVADGSVESFEFLRIGHEKGTTTFYAQPNGVAPTGFTLSAHGADWARFENPAHDFPNRIEYRRDGEALNAQISGPGTEGKPMQIPFAYRRCAAS
jgi:hypothetical protein